MYPVQYPVLKETIEMSIIRKFQRKKHVENTPKNENRKSKFFDFLFSIGVIISFTSLLFSFIFYITYIGGRPEGIANTIIGTLLVEKIEAGDVNYKEMALLCVILAVLGLVISGISLMIKYIRKQTMLN